MIKWYTFAEKRPIRDQKIVIELDGCKCWKFLKTTLRPSEGLGAYKKWCDAKEFMDLFNKKNK
jgi:hypothetical protein